MKGYLSFTKKECTEILRTGKLTIQTILFILFGIMNPAIAKLTPWLMETMSDSLKESGMTVTNITVNALSSWTQFYKNIPIALIVFILMTGGIFTAEYQTGTLIPVLTKGLKRSQAAASKSTVAIVFWIAEYFLCYLITFGYTGFFWDNSEIVNLIIPAVFYCIFGIWIISVMLLASVIFTMNGAVLACTGGTALGIYLLGMIPDIKEYLPFSLTDSMNLLTGAAVTSQYYSGLALTILLTAINLTAQCIIFNKRSI